MEADAVSSATAGAVSESIAILSLSNDVVIEQDGDYKIVDEKCLPFECKEVLGNGWSAVVQKVEHKRTKELFANKVIKFPRKGKSREQAEERYRNEIDIIRRLRTHTHVIRLFATYITTRTRLGGLLLQPAAEAGDLQDYLDRYADLIEHPPDFSADLEEMTKILEQAFGCLASGLAYMHGKGIRHKDIKPGNILIHQGIVIYTDFGASKDTTKDGQCTTEGAPESWTRRYCAPEVREWEKRNFAADVFSLGCVFVEMLMRLSRLPEPEGLEDDGYSGILDALHVLLKYAKVPSKMEFLVRHVKDMIARDSMGRLASDKVSDAICCKSGFSCVDCHFVLSPDMSDTQSESGNESEEETGPCESLWKNLRTSMSTSMFERTETKMFLPNGTFDKISPHTAGLSGRRKLVLEVMGIDSSMPSEDDRALADYILNSAQKVFLITVYLRLEQLHAAMKLFKVSSFKDEHLPVEEWTAQQLQHSPKIHRFVQMETFQRRRRRKEREKNTGRVWDLHTISMFQDCQWIFLAPTISIHEQNCHFDNRCPIPFTTKNTQQSSGAHGIVYKYTIHPAHFKNSSHQYETEPSVVAVKAFRKGGKNVAVDVKREVDALAKMNQLGEEHIVRFITSFQRGTREDLEYYALFEWADGGNLSDFWWQAHKRERTAPLVKWVMEQLYGLAKALSAVHHMPDGVSYSHGDLKPGNILWFPDSGGYGTLKIGDWGEAKTHNQETAFPYGRLDTTAKFGTRRYEPPETGLQSLLPKGTPHVRSCLYDVWGMGCIILEFIIWLLYDNDELCRFNNNNLGHFGPSDMFYEISHERVVRIHRVAEHWMEHMAKDGLCRAGETALGDLLHVVRTGLLVVELPESDGSDVQAAVGLLSITHDDNPLISVTTPESADAEVVPDSASKKQTRYRATVLESKLRQIAEARADESYWHRGQEPGPAPVDDTSLSHLPAPITRLYTRADDMIDNAHSCLDPIRPARCITSGCQNWAATGRDVCYDCLDGLKVH